MRRAPVGVALRKALPMLGIVMMSLLSMGQSGGFCPIASPPPPPPATTPPPDGFVGNPYRFVVGPGATGGSTDAPGMTAAYVGMTGVVLSGTPSRAGVFSVNFFGSGGAQRFTVHPSVEVRPANETVAVGGKVRFAAHRVDDLSAAAATRPEITQSVNWSSAHLSIATISSAPAGEATGIAPSPPAARIVATAATGASGRADLTVTAAPALPTLSVTATADNTNPTPAQGFTVNVVFFNTGSVDAVSPAVSFAASAGAFFRSSFTAPGGYICIPNQTLNPVRLDCTASLLAANSTVAFQVPVDTSVVLTPSNVTMTTSVSASGTSPIAISTPVTIKVPRVFVTAKTNLTGSVLLGETVTYEITVHNFGNDNATSFQVHDVHAAELRFVSTTAANAAVTASPILTQFPFGNIPAGQTIRFQVTMQATAVGTFRNDAGALLVQPPQGQGVPPEFAMVVVGLPSNLASFAITPAPATLNSAESRQLQAIATLSDGTTIDYTQFAVWDSSVTTVAGVTNVGTKGTLFARDPGVTSITASIPGTNLATGFTLTVNALPAPILDMSMTAANPSPVITEDPSIAAALTNTGNADATNLQLRFNAPPNVTFGSVTPPSGFACSPTPPVAPTQIDCVAPTFAAGATALFPLPSNLAQVPTHGPLTFSASAQADGLATRIFNTTIGVKMPFVKVINKQNLTGSVEVGQLVTFEITVENGGNEAATSFLLEDVHAPELTFVSTTATTPQPVSVTPTRTVFTFGPLAAGPITGPAPGFTFQVTMRANAVGTFRNDAKAFGVQPLQGTDVVVSALVTVTAAQPADMSVTTSVLNVPVAVGQQIELILDTANLDGQDAAHNVVVEVIVPAGAAFSSASGPGAVDATTPGIVRLRLESVGPNTSLQHRLLFNTTAPGVQTFFTQVSTASPDTNFTNNGPVSSQVTVSHAPVASFTANCVHRACTFDAAGSSDADGTIASYLWDLGDGTLASGVNVAHTYQADGTFTVRLTVEDNHGLTHTVTQQVTVSAPPSAGPVTDILFSKGDGQFTVVPFVGQVRHDAQANTLTVLPPAVMSLGTGGQPGPLAGDNALLAVADQQNTAPVNTSRVVLFNRDAANNWVHLFDDNVVGTLIRGMAMHPARTFVWYSHSALVSGLEERLGVMDVVNETTRNLTPLGTTGNPRAILQLIVNPDPALPFVYGLAAGTTDLSNPEELVVWRYDANGDLALQATSTDVPFGNVMALRNGALYIGTNLGVQYVVPLVNGLPGPAPVSLDLTGGTSGLFGEAAFAKTVIPPNTANVCKYTLADVDRILMMEVNNQTPSISAPVAVVTTSAPELMFSIAGHPTAPFLYVFGDAQGQPPAPPIPLASVAVYEVNPATCGLTFRTRVSVPMPPGPLNGVLLLPQ